MTTTHADPAVGLGYTSAPSPKSRILRAVAKASAGAARPLAVKAFFPLWGIVHHTGRKSGRSYAIPVVVERTAGGFVIPLPFGGSTQWARNVLAAGGGSIRWRGRDYGARDPEVIDWEQAESSYPAVLRRIVPVTGISQFLRVRAVELPSD